MDKKVISEYQQKVEALHDKITVLKASLDEKDREISDLKNGERRRESVSYFFISISYFYCESNECS